MRDTYVTVVGNVAADPEVRETPSGSRVTTFRIGSTPRVRDRGTQEWVDGRTSWYAVSAWNQLGTNVAESVRRGERVVVTGRLEIEPWQDRDGHERISVKITADSVGHDLTFGTTRYQRVVRSAGPSAENATTDADPGDENLPADPWDPGSAVVDDESDVAEGSPVAAAS